ncbi:hypothetical protein FA10DRAFT_197722 [Acaromyces ingoldii]|uniref:Uncharacterized protein n=1 Tax=Acaromyces ingoldii TaxID=215250 RepID=A0A316YBM9_9BASI|nr:hypothetical protein FA10DRAFT_197722 [Acaromyces ingoldii]PWN87190.1 hypothetical protein FA10DRAFT_197722 [Acaromyces ingoldii]
MKEAVPTKKKEAQQRRKKKRRRGRKRKRGKEKGGQCVAERALCARKTRLERERKICVSDEGSDVVCNGVWGVK